MAEEESKSELAEEGEVTESEENEGSEENLDAEAADADEPQNRRARRAAASQARKARLRERREAEAVGLDAQEIIDDALVRSTDSAGKWLKQNSSKLQWALVAVVVVWAGWGIYGWQVDAARAEASDAVARGIAAERGRIGDPAEQGQPNEQKVIDPTPIFKDKAALQSAAEARLREAVAERPGAGTTLYAKLALAGVLLDGAKFDDAEALYAELKGAEGAKSDPELRGRAMEGMALVAEAKGDKAKALSAYEDLKAAGIDGFSDLATLQQARLNHELGNADKAKELIGTLRDKFGASLADPMKTSMSYLRSSVKQLADELGMEPPKPAEPKSITKAQIDAIQRQAQEQINAATERAKNDNSQDEPASTTEGAGKDTTAGADAPQK